MAVLGIMALGAGVAQARIVHKEIQEAGLPFSSDPSLGGGIDVGIAINQATQDFYVANVGSGDVVEFNPAHEEIRTITSASAGVPGGEPFAGHMNIAVDTDPTSASFGDLYVPDEHRNHVVDKLTSEGVFICELDGSTSPCPGAQSPAPLGSVSENPEAVAVDPSTGYVYVSDKGNNVIDVFSPSGAYVNQITGTPPEPLISSPRDVKVDSHGDVYVANAAGASVLEFKPSTEPVEAGTTWTESTLSGGPVPSIAIDGNDNVYVAVESAGGAVTVTEHSPTGTVLSEFGQGLLTTGFGMAVNNTTNEIYYAETFANDVHLFNTLVVPTVVTAEPPTAVTHTGAKVEGTVNPEELTITNCFFEYGTGPLAGNGAGLTVPCSEIPTGNTAVPVSANLVGLEPGTTYHYELVVQAEGNFENGGEKTFETPPLVTVTTEAASGETAETATLNGKVKAGEEGATYYFEYGKGKIGEGSFTNKSPEPPGALGEGEHPVSTNVTGLEPGTPYHFRLVALANGTFTPIEGVEQEFTTKFASPVVISSSVVGHPARTSVTLTGEINPKNSKTEYDIEYGETEASGAPGSPTKLTALESPNGPQKIAPQTLEELKAGTIYHYRIVAHNAGGTTLGAEGTFETAAPQLPIVEAESSEQVTQTTATVTAKVNPNGLQTTYILEVGTEVEGKVAYTPTFGEVGSGSGGVSLMFALTNLLPGTTYHYRIVAVNEDGTVEGADITFATPGFVSPIVEPPHPLLIPVPPVHEEIVKTHESKLEKALKACATKPRKKRATCDRQAEKKYGPKVHRKTKPKHKKK
jgi:hypothetical protein